MANPKDNIRDGYRWATQAFKVDILNTNILSEINNFFKSFSYNFQQSKRVVQLFA